MTSPSSTCSGRSLASRLTQSFGLRRFGSVAIRVQRVVELPLPDGGLIGHHEPVVGDLDPTGERQLQQQGAGQAVVVVAGRPSWLTPASS